ncbi:glycerol-3-phosphate dehydrogenase [candidate division WOR-1 bacterium RIFOXYC2_FULL_37_10]|uniref:Glycerol-3-phosphate dehydrogenase [NAD(P)+] n=1 Tax=candidate division WOR-1 bacterium RIFOXYB2_FULL_37_13 TaxID=1802579 RepID=A0A1F4SRF1_UNCSA|nr:MAG: glycerol-3-phosphate dehydrogenase [candidate division WOR-1 bacterium RIFOXYA2_FULL_37_7]OGC22243.1 MAG: glycerol-3-phosphate dehydrogenase [candidate division WOR-1 bacterium RIFOXYB2_FULL_37_13]OGC34535.1 MAG: glycerol-3-phosphate dehydrogenase [candidate division WOR-1 bacterium RIFOXYC2_FULL_37_10]
MKKISVIGAGAWGTTLALLLSQNQYEITLWTHEEEVISSIKTFRENKKYLNGCPLSPNIIPDSNIKTAIKEAEIVVYATPTQFMRGIVKESMEYFKGKYIVSASKGIEISTLKFPSQIISEFTKEPVTILSGPNLAKEIANGFPAASIAASQNTSYAKLVQSLFEKCKNFRVYTGCDPLGAEIGGALKNVIAIAAGALEEKQLGDNAKAALIIRGISEITKLGMAMGAAKETFSGLSGLGDLIATCQSALSRNHTVGAKLAKGETLDSIVNSMKQVAEGVATTKAAVKLADKYKVEMPIIFEVYEVLFNNKSVDKALINLMSRPQKNED